VSHRLSRRLNNVTGQCPVVCPPHVDNDETVARGISTVPGLFVPKTFRSQERIVPIGELSFPRLFVPGNFRSLGTKVPWNFRSRELSFPGNESSWELSFPGPFVPRNFCSQDFSFPGTFVPPTILQGMAVNADSYSNCQNLFRSRPIDLVFVFQK